MKQLAEDHILIGENFDPASLTPNGYDVRIDKIRIEANDLDMANAVVPPRTSFFISTIERMNMPKNVGGQIWIRSSYARKSVMGSFGFIDAGFNGHLTLSFYNSSSREIDLKHGDRIAQVVFIELTSESDITYGERSGNYQNSTGIKLS